MDTHKNEFGYQDVRDVINRIYESYNRAKPKLGKQPDRFVRKPEFTRHLLDVFEGPDKRSYNIAVTGSKGKGSHAILLAGMLQQLGLKVGLFTGPHLVDFMERFRVNGETLDECRFRDFVVEVTDEVRKLPLGEAEYVGPVGIMAVIAARWFAEEKTDVNIYELGRGALHDDVNQIHHQGAILTPVFLEHSIELGPTLQDVAREKMGVLRPETSWAVTHSQSPIVHEQFVEVTSNVACETAELYRDFDFKSQPVSGTQLVEVSLCTGIRTRLCSTGDYQLANAAVALRAAQFVLERRSNTSMSPTPCIDLSSLRLPGRLEPLRQHPLVVVDGTIHAQSAQFVQAWARSQLESGAVKRFGAVLCLPTDKDVDGVFMHLRDVVDWVVLTEAHNPYLHFSSRNVDVAQKWFERVDKCNYIEDAVQLAMPRLTEQDGLLLLGTQSFVGDALRYFGKTNHSIWTTQERHA